MSYRTYHRRSHRVFDDGTEEFGNLSDEEETVDEKLARLRQEVEELKATLEEQDDQEHQTQENDPFNNVLSISKELDAIHITRKGGTEGAHSDFNKALQSFNRQSQQLPPLKATEDQPTSSTADNSQALQALSKAAEFDSRLSFLETALGLTGSNIPDSGDKTSKPVLPTLGNLERLIGTALAQPDQLEAAQSKTRQLLKEAERLSKLKTEQSNERTPATNGQRTEPAPDNEEQNSKINALYGILPTIDSLSPTLPLLLDRLRTLRLLHTTAADASATLDDIEEQQEEQAEEIKQWREAVEKVETNLKQEQGTLAENVEKMSAWIKELEERISKI
jgi:nuclear migration protein JNM1